MIKSQPKPSLNIQKYLDIINRTKDIPKAKEEGCIAKAKTNPIFKKELFEAHLKMLVGIARNYTSHNETIEDLIQEGVKGLEKALILFKPNIKVRFNTYARFWIRAYIIKYFAENVRGFKVPSSISAKLYKLNKTIEKLSKKLEREPSDEEVARELNYDSDYVRFLRKYLFPHLALDAQIDGKDGKSFSTVGESLIDNHRDNACESLIKRDGVENIKNAILNLSEKERFVIENRYGLNENDEQTLEVVGKKMDLSAERVRQIQEMAESKLRKVMNR